MSTEPISCKNNIDLFSLGTKLVEQNELEQPTQINPPFPIYRLFMKGKLNVYLLWPLKKNLISLLVTSINLW